MLKYEHLRLGMKIRCTKSEGVEGCWLTKGKAYTIINIHAEALDYAVRNNRGDHWWVSLYDFEHISGTNIKTKLSKLLKKEAQ